MIAHWPAGIKARGELRAQVGHVVDVMATCVEVGGAVYPAKVGNRAITPPEGKSLLPAIADEPIDREEIFWEHEGNRAVRAGDWKLVAKHAGPWELYDLSTDRTEGIDLAAKHPDKATDLSDKYDAWARRAHVERWPISPPKKKE